MMRDDVPSSANYKIHILKLEKAKKCYLDPNLVSLHNALGLKLDLA